MVHIFHEKVSKVTKSDVFCTNSKENNNDTLDMEIIIDAEVSAGLLEGEGDVERRS
jgi:hypothetical protein